MATEGGFQGVHGKGAHSLRRINCAFVSWGSGIITRETFRVGQQVTLVLVHFYCPIPSLLNNYSSKLFVIDDYCILYHKFVSKMLFFYPYTKVSALILQGWPSW